MPPCRIRAGSARTGEAQPTATHAGQRFSLDAAALARLGHALSDPTRAGILLALREARACPSDLADALEVSRQVMSNHLACLRGCGLVEAVPDGRRSWYRLTDPHLAPAFDELMRVVLFVEPDCCDGKGCTC